jgi:hypothetical protein
MPPAITPQRNATHGSVAKAALPLLASVRLRAGLSTEGVAVPASASGTIVEILGRGEAYVVEFFAPRHAVVTVRHDMLELDRG